jgi:hypothetical protein
VGGQKEADEKYQGVVVLIRNLLPSDYLSPPYWVLGGVRPAEDTTLVAEDSSSGKIIGILWLAYGGPAAMFAIHLSAESRAAWALCNAAIKLARDKGCKSLLLYIRSSRLLSAIQGRGGVITDSISHMVVFPVTKEEA